MAGQKSGEDQSAQYLHRGIAARTFQRRFELADYVKVVDASLVNGLLTINLQREIPDEMKPRRIAIATSDN
ncbi:Hsp20 family protein, partial [Klebsiella aerogenes]|uniref:Hsp20 family protein n=1 Tax=Klebsiella aerogenes TaxID=548 RepID=UPI0030DA93D4